MIIPDAGRLRIREASVSLHAVPGEGIGDGVSVVLAHAARTPDFFNGQRELSQAVQT
jgi:hypothetical protein